MTLRNHPMSLQSWLSIAFSMMLLASCSPAKRIAKELSTGDYVYEHNGVPHYPPFLSDLFAHQLDSLVSNMVQRNDALLILKKIRPSEGTDSISLPSLWDQISIILPIGPLPPPPCPPPDMPPPRMACFGNPHWVINDMHRLANKGIIKLQAIHPGTGEETVMSIDHKDFIELPPEIWSQELQLKMKIGEEMKVFRSLP